MITLIRTDRSVTTVAPADPVIGFTLTELYALIGNGCGIVVEADGSLRQLMPGDVVSGDVLIVERNRP